MEIIKIVVEETEVGTRIDKLLMTKELGVTSRTQVQNYISEGHLLVNGAAQKANYKVRLNDEIELMLPKGDFKTIVVDKMYDEKDNEIDSCPHATMKLYIPCDFSCPEYSILRKEKNN